MFKKKEKISKSQKICTMRVGTNKIAVIILWMFLIGSVSFGVYKNFTAIDIHTVHETEIIKQEVIDTNSIENFVSNFAKSYYSWENDKGAIARRTTTINRFLTKELQDLNADTVRSDIPTCSSVKDVQIWNVTQSSENEFTAIYAVDQTVSESDYTKTIRSAYEVTVYVDSSGNMVIVKNPTLSSIPVKSGYTPKTKEFDSTIDMNKINEATEFLNTFFALYPGATKKELAYYVRGNALEPVADNYLFSELINPIFTKDGENIRVYVSVKFLDQQTKAAQISQYDLTLQKNENWMIVE